MVCINMGGASSPKTCELAPPKQQPIWFIYSCLVWGKGQLNSRSDKYSYYHKQRECIVEVALGVYWPCVLPRQGYIVF